MEAVNPLPGFGIRLARCAGAKRACALLLAFAACANLGAQVLQDAASAKTAKAQPGPGDGTLVYGEGWAALVSVPPGWDSDCCDLARAHHVNLLVFPHAWDRGSPDSVMQLLVWIQPKASLDADFQADAKAYLERFPGIEAQAFALTAPGRACRGAVYIGGDEVRDYVVFCDPGNGLDFHYSWSMQLQGAHADRNALENAFRAVVAQTTPLDAKIQKSPQ